MGKLLEKVILPEKALSKGALSGVATIVKKYYGPKRGPDEEPSNGNEWDALVESGGIVVTDPDTQNKYALKEVFEDLRTRAVAVSAGIVGTHAAEIARTSGLTYKQSAARYGCTRAVIHELAQPATALLGYSRPALLPHLMASWGDMRKVFTDRIAEIQDLFTRGDMLLYTPDTDITTVDLQSSLVAYMNKAVVKAFREKSAEVTINGMPLPENVALTKFSTEKIRFLADNVVQNVARSMAVRDELTIERRHEFPAIVVQTTVDAQAEVIRLEISDNGYGFTPEAAAIGRFGQIPSNWQGRCEGNRGRYGCPGPHY